MRGLLLSRPAWSSSSLSTKTAVVLCTLNCCMANTSAGAVGRAPLCGTVATCAACCPSRLYSTTRSAQGTRDGENSSSSNSYGGSGCSSNSATTPEEANDDAMDLIWAALPDLHEHHNEMTLTSVPKQHKPPTSAPETSPPSCEHGGTSNANDTPESSPASQPSYVWVSLHNMPRNWLHEDIVEMIHQIAEHAGITEPQAPNAPSSALGQEDNGADDTDEGTSSALNYMASPFVRRLHIPFGRRTGIVYGSPKLLLTSPQLADHLTHSLTFDPDDFRSRVYFTRLKPEEVPRSYQEQQLHEEDSAGSNPATGNRLAQVMYTPIEETVEREQDEALRTLELDRYLFAPDLLLDIAKARQRRLVTKREKVLLDAFVDGEEDSDEGEEDGTRGGDGGAENGSEAVGAPVTHRRQPQRRASPSAGSTKRRKMGHTIGHVRAGTQKHLGRGSMHNMPIPKPYVEGRNL